MYAKTLFTQKITHVTMTPVKYVRMNVKMCKVSIEQAHIDADEHARTCDNEDCDECN